MATKEGFDEQWSSHDYMSVGDKRKYRGGRETQWSKYRPDMNLRPAWGNDDFDFHKSDFENNGFKLRDYGRHRDDDVDDDDDDSYRTISKKIDMQFLKKWLMYIIVFIVILAIISMLLQKSNGRK